MSETICKEHNMQDNLILRKLSPELRNAIYELVLLDEEPINIAKERQPAITRVCRQVRQECIAMYYFHNKFSFCTKSRLDDSIDPLIH